MPTLFFRVVIAYARGIAYCKRFEVFISLMITK